MASSSQNVRSLGAPTAQIQGAVNVIPVRLARNDVRKKYAIMQFNESSKVDFATCGSAKLERENNFKEFKSAYDVDTMPKFGAGSEFGREQKEEARKKKFGIKIKKYNPQEQPWLLKLGTGKQARRFKGSRKGGVLENASYYIFTQGPDGAFEASPVEEWYDFHPQPKYKTLTAEEAEEEYTKRSKTLNHFAIMVSKRFKGGENDEGDADEGESSGKKKSSKKDKSLMLTEMDDDWGDSDEDDNDDNPEERDEDDEGKSKKKKKLKTKKDESDNEAVEEQDELDEGQEVDYISGSSSDDEQMYDETGRDETDKYEQKGVDDEDGLRKLLDSDEEDEEEEKKDEENEEDEEGRTKEEQSKASDSESSSDSDIDSEPEKDFNFPSALFIPDSKRGKKQVDETDAAGGNRPATPLSDALSSGKRKRPESQSPGNASKKPKVEGSGASTSSASAAGASSGSQSQSDGGIEGLVKRYLSRKPITLKDLLQKVTSKYPAMTKDQVVKVIGQILQRLKLDKLKANNKLYFSISKDSSS